MSDAPKRKPKAGSERDRRDTLRDEVESVAFILGVTELGQEPLPPATTDPARAAHEGNEKAAGKAADAHERGEQQASGDEAADPNWRTRS